MKLSRKASIVFSVRDTKIYTWSFIKLEKKTYFILFISMYCCGLFLNCSKQLVQQK